MYKLARTYGGKAVFIFCCKDGFNGAGRYIQKNGLSKDLRVGDHVRAVRNSEWHPAVIAKDYGDDTFLLTWEDGDPNDRVQPQKLIMIPTANQKPPLEDGVLQHVNGDSDGRAYGIRYAAHKSIWDREGTLIANSGKCNLAVELMKVL
mmetsp:Transcript_131098/g.241181  ORF Transcript_131098/g.241181 Transcript_131098/m.241181 type:complete len:148 (-) Transcript_131098:95-538(-)